MYSIVYHKYTLIIIDIILLQVLTHTYFMSHVMLRHILFVMARELLTERMWLVTSEHALTLSNCVYETKCS